MVNLGIFEILVLAGIFLLVFGLGAIGYLTYQRYRNKSVPAIENSPLGFVETAHDSRVVDAEDLASRLRSEADEYAAQVRAKAEAQLEAVESVRHDTEEETRQRRNELREQRLEIERREQRLADREERLDSDNRALEEKARHLDVNKAELKAQRRSLQEAEADLQHALERIAGLTAEQAKAELVAAVEHDAKRQPFSSPATSSGRPPSRPSHALR